MKNLKLRKKNPWLKEDVSWNWETKVNSDWIISDLSISKEDIVLDIGCGPGAYLNDINLKTQAKCYGIDIRTDVFKLNRNKNVHLLQGNMLEIPHKPGTFTKIFSLGTLEHDPDTDKVFSEVSRVLKRNGKVLLTVPNKLSFFHLTKRVKQFLGKWDIGYEKSFTIRELKKLLEKQGLRVEEEYISPHPQINNFFNYSDNFLNNLNNKKFGFFISIVASKR